MFQGHHTGQEEEQEEQEEQEFIQNRTRAGRVIPDEMGPACCRATPASGGGRRRDIRGGGGVYSESYVTSYTREAQFLT